MSGAENARVQASVNVMGFTEETVHPSAACARKCQKKRSLSALTGVGPVLLNGDQMLLFLLNVEFDLGDLPRSSLNFLETFSMCDLLFQNSDRIFGDIIFCLNFMVRGFRDHWIVLTEI